MRISLCIATLTETKNKSKQDAGNRIAEVKKVFANKQWLLKQQIQDLDLKRAFLRT